MKIKCKVVPGSGKATRTLAQQKEFFVAEGIPEDMLESGTINIDTSPGVLEVLSPDVFLKDIEWRANFLEDFSFLPIKIIFEGSSYPGFIYKPHRTKNPKTMTELISVPVQGIEYGKEIEIEFDDQSALIRR